MKAPTTLQKFLQYFTSVRINARHMRLLIISTILLYTVSGIGLIPGILEHPQFTENLDLNFIYSLFDDQPWLFWSYHIYFILDCIWPPILLLAIWKFIMGFKEKYQLTHTFWKFFFGLFTICTIGALLSDYTENFFYFFQYRYEKIIANIKIGLYAFVLLTWISCFLITHVSNFLEAIISFVKSAFFSLLILLIFGILLPTAPQVNSIVVNLYVHPWNLFILLFFAFIYAIVLAHYPSYFNTDEENRKWYSAKHRFLLFKTIYYKYKEKHIKSSEGKIEGYVNFMFRSLGVMFYVALFYMIAYASEVNFSWPISMSHVALSLLIIGIYLLYLLRRIKSRWLNKNFLYLYDNLPNFYDGDFVPDNNSNAQMKRYLKAIKGGQSRGSILQHKSLYDIQKSIFIYAILFLVTIVVHSLLFIAIVSTSIEAYSNTTAILSLMCIALQMISFIYFRTFRSIFRFTFYNEKQPSIKNAFYILRVFDMVKSPKIPQITQKEIDQKEQEIIKFFSIHNGKFSSKYPLLKLFKFLRFGIHSNNIIFLRITIFIGILNSLFFLLINVFSDITLSLNVNAILIILSAFFLYYGIAIVITKNFIYYRYSKEQFAYKYKRHYYMTIGIIIAIFLTLYVLARKNPNELFTLEPVNKSASVSLEEFKSDLTKRSGPKYYIGSYGGGMKANAWTLTVLKELYDQDHDFFKKTVVISGASGGTMGLINMSAIISASPNDPSKWQPKITKISTENILSLDLTHVLGRDLFSYMFIPDGVFKTLGKDRSTKAMERYESIANDNIKNAKTLSYQAYWKELYDKYDKSYPVLISNTTNVRGNQGMAVSVRAQKGSVQESLLFQGADNILNVDTKTLTYFDAASTSNRFPLISPAAKIETKGNYNDGGIYENSGLLSAFKFFRAINTSDNIGSLSNIKEPTTFICIDNSKERYIKHSLQQYFKDSIHVKKINNNTEINAILNAVASTEMMPIFIKTELKRFDKYHPNVSFKTIYLPHRYSMNDIKSFLDKEIQIGSISLEKTDKLLYQCVKHNDSIIKKWVNGIGASRYEPVIEPPMSRVITGEAYKFMQKMLQHEVPKTVINEITNSP